MYHIMYDVNNKRNWVGGHIRTLYNGLIFSINLKLFFKISSIKKKKLVIGPRFEGRGLQKM